LSEVEPGYVVVQVAVLGAPPLNVTFEQPLIGPLALVPLKLTVPVGLPAPGAMTPTVATYVTLCPTTALASPP
jgi:hypothetical protein